MNSVYYPTVWKHPVTSKPTTDIYHLVLLNGCENKEVTVGWACSTSRVEIKLIKISGREISFKTGNRKNEK